MKYLSIIILALAMSACARGDKGDIGSPGGQGPTGPQGPAAPVPTVDPIQAQINTLVAEENKWRESQGQTELSQGLSCSVQAISAGQYLSSSSPGYTAAQAIVLAGSSYPFLGSNFDQPNSGAGPNSVITDPYIQSLFTSNNYRISCLGQLVVLEDGYHGFTMSSDDGSILTIDGAQVINNDANHGVVTVSGTKLLRAGVHTFSLLYAQSGGGNFALVLNMNGSVLPAANLYH
jgi:hypothetical protein